jgi:type II secretory ATPase GspE/PulE/Tfp pilus assembly ATPase PilB-like protein
VHIGVISPANEKTVNEVKGLQERGYQPVLYMVSTASLERAWQRYSEVSFASEVKAGVLDISNEEIQGFISKVHTISDVRTLIEDVLKMKKSFRISRILEIILAGSLSMNASDVHIEPEATYARLRYRLDGVLTDIINFDLETYTLLLSRIKLLSGLKLNVKASAQDGRFSIKIDTVEIEIRTSILPGAYSESIVLRILNPEAISVPMEELGIEPELSKILEHEIRKPNGMLLNTGPTGSGKTTTLYAFLKKVHTSDIKIITIEDPIEYHLPGIVQTQVDTKNYTFAEGLRSALRQDPDVIMVGEIRDSETASIAINAGLTGHLVFSTLHTNNAAGAFPRLIDLGVDPKVISSAVNVVMAQRLVRKLCKKCAKEAPIPDEYKNFIKDVLASIKNKAGLVQTETMLIPVGCEACNGVGYKGRLGIFEAILVDENVDKILRESPSERDIMKVAEPQGILTMLQDGVLKVLKGVTSLEELSRVIDLGV